MLKETLLIFFAAVVVSLAQEQQINPYIPTQTTGINTIPQWGWGGQRFGQGGYWVYGPSGWTWFNGYNNGWMPGWGWGPNYWNNYYFSTPSPGK